MKRQRRFTIPADVLLPHLKAKAFPEINGELDKVVVRDMEEGGVLLSSVTNLDGIECSDDVSLDSKEVRDVAIDLVKRNTKVTAGNYTCSIGDDRSAVVINTSSESPHRT